MPIGARKQEVLSTSDIYVNPNCFETIATKTEIIAKLRIQGIFNNPLKCLKIRAVLFFTHHLVREFKYCAKIRPREKAKNTTIELLH